MDLIAYLLFWVILLVLSVFDLKFSRLPNKLILLLLPITLCLHLMSDNGNLNIAGTTLTWLVTVFSYFIVGIVAYYFRMISSGDVKLYCSIGSYVGLNNIFEYSSLALIMGGMTGIMYWLLSRLHVGSELMILQYEVKGRVCKNNSLTYMPFGPALVLGLALHQYLFGNSYLYL